VKFKTDRAADAELVQVAPGLLAWSPVRVKAEGDYDVELEVVAVPGDCDRAGRFVCRNLTVHQRAGGGPVTSEALRAVPVATLTKKAAPGNVLTEPEDTSAEVKVYPHVELSEQGAAQLRLEGPTDRALKFVANLYRLAVVLEEPPTQSVAEALGLPRSTAGRWVARARDGGFLGAAEGPGKAGG
jgi:hypothetical protein